MILTEWRIFAKMLIQSQIYSTNIRFYEVLTVLTEYLKVLFFFLF